MKKNQRIICVILAILWGYYCAEDQANAQALSCGQETWLGQFGTGDVISSINGQLQYLVVEVKKPNNTYQTYVYSIGLDLIPGTADDMGPIQILTTSLPAKPKINFFGIVAFEDAIPVVGSTYVPERSLITCYWPICQSAYYFPIQTIYRTATSQPFNIPNAAADGVFSGFYWWYYDIVYARTTYSNTVTHLQAPSANLMSYTFLNGTEDVHDERPFARAAIFDLTNVDDFGNATMTTMNGLYLNTDIYFWDRATRTTQTIQSGGSRLDLQLASVYQMQNGEKIFFRSGFEQGSSSISDIYFEHSRNGAFSTPALAAPRYPGPLLNDGVSQDKPWFEYQGTGQNYRLAIPSKVSNLNERPVDVFDFDNSTLQFTRHRQWGGNGTPTRALRLQDGFVYGGKKATLAPQVVVDQLVVVDCR